MRWFQTGGQDYVATGSWDKTVKFWDLKGAQPVGTLQCQDRVYSMDVKDQLLVVATAERHINMINLNEPTKIYKTIVSPLKWQTRVVSCFTDASGFAVGSIEGRCAIQYVEDKDTRYILPPLSRTSLTLPQPQLLLQMPPPKRHQPARRLQSLLRQRHLLPPAARHLQHRRL